MKVQLSPETANLANFIHNIIVIVYNVISMVTQNIHCPCSMLVKTHDNYHYVWILLPPAILASAVNQHTQHKLNWV